MPVLIIGAATGVGRRLASLLLDQDAQVRVFLEADDDEFRSAGCKVAVGDFDDIGRIESAMEQTHTVVHLAGGPEAPKGRTLEWFVQETTEVAVRAAVSAGVVRFLSLSELGADPASANAYLRVRGCADELITTSGLQHAVVRCAPILAPDAQLGVALLRAMSARVPVAPGRGSQRLNPIWAGDVAQALLLADARETAVSGTWELGGPEVVTFDELVARATKRTRIAHRKSVPGLSAASAETLRHDRVADSSRFVSQFGPLALTGLDRVLQAMRAMSER